MQGRPPANHHVDGLVRHREPGFFPALYRPRSIPIVCLRASTTLDVPVIVDPQWIDAWVQTTASRLGRSPEISEVYTEWNRAYESDQAILSARLRQAGRELDTDGCAFVPARGYRNVGIAAALGPLMT